MLRDLGFLVERRLIASIQRGVSSPTLYPPVHAYSISRNSPTVSASLAKISVYQISVAFSKTPGISSLGEVPEQLAVILVTIFGWCRSLTQFLLTTSSGISFRGIYHECMNVRYARCFHFFHFWVCVWKVRDMNIPGCPVQGESLIVVKKEKSGDQWTNLRIERSEVYRVHVNLPRTHSWL